MNSYEQALHLFGRWLAEELQIYTVDKITENVIRRYIADLQERGKPTNSEFIALIADKLQLQLKASEVPNF